MVVGLLRHGSQRGSVARGTVIVGILRVGGLVLGYFAQVVLARGLGSYEYGIYRYAFSWVALLGSFACVGFPLTLQRYVPQHAAEGEWGLLKGLIRGSRLVVTAASLLGAVLVAAFFWKVGGRWLGAEQARAVVMSAWIIPVLAWFLLNTQLARSFHLMAVAFLPWNLGRPGAALLAGLCALWCMTPRGAAALVAFGVFLGVFVALQWLWLEKSCPFPVRGVRARWAWRKWLRVSIPLVLLTGFAILQDQLGVLMVGSILGPAEAGMFAVVTYLARLVSFFLLSVNDVIAPKVAELHHAGSQEKLQKLLSTSVRWVFWPSLLVSVVLIVGARNILGIFGEDFATGSVPLALAILVVGNLINAGAGSSGVVLNVTGHQDIHVVVYAGSAAANVVLNIALLPRFGLIGGAMAASVTMILWNVLLTWFVVRRLRLQPTILTAWR